MKNQKITKGNILIAEFMNHKIWMVKHYEGDTQSDRQETSVKDYEKFLEKGFKYDPYARPFHSSWDILMPVMDKIYKLHKFNEFYIKPNSALLYLTNKIKLFAGGVSNDNGKEGTMVYKYISAETGIEATWIVAVEFIKWHNEQKEIMDLKLQQKANQ